MTAPENARDLLARLTGKIIPTLTGRPNQVISVDGDDVIVGTGKSPNGQPVPIRWVQEAIDRLYTDGEIEVSVASVGYRSAFIGAVLASIPGTATTVRPRTVRLRPPPR